MAIGFSPHYSLEFPIEELTERQFLALTVVALELVHWKISSINPSGFVAYTKFSMQSSGEEVTLVIDNGFAILKSECIGSQVMDWGKNRKNLERLIATIDELKLSGTHESFDRKYEEIKQRFSQEELDLPFSSTHASKSKFGFLSIFIPVRGFFVTPLIIDLNILVFIAMVISGVNAFLPDSESLIKWGANFRPMTLEGESWRLFTNFFLHIGLFHLALNMYALLYIGILLEPRLGSLKYATAYVLTGLAASVTSLVWHPITISAGASGAIFGLYGVFLAMLTTNLIEKSARKALFVSIGVFVLYNLANGVKGGIDNAAHIGGLLSGIVIGYAFYPSLIKPGEKRLEYSTVGLLFAVVLLSSFAVFKKVPNDIGKYQEKMKSFASMESQALEVYKLAGDSPKEKFLYEIKERGIYYWNEDIQLLQDADKLDLPQTLHDRNKKLIEYCELRLKCYELMYKSVSEGGRQYDDQIRDYNQQIEAVANEIK